MEIPLIKKHQYIGQDIFLVSSEGKLFFGLFEDNELYLYEQKVCSATEVKNGYTCQSNVVSFSVNQDDDKKTPLGRARFFVILVDNIIFDKIIGDTKVEKIVFLCDLLSPYNTMKRIWSSYDDSNLDFIEKDKQKSFDRVSFHKNFIELWESNVLSPGALQIKLPQDWVDVVVSLIVSIFYFN